MKRIFKNAPEIKRYLKQNGITDKVIVKRERYTFDPSDLYSVRLANLESMTMVTSRTTSAGKEFYSNNPEVARKLQEIYRLSQGTNILV
jgi:hypothetical protein